MKTPSLETQLRRDATARRRVLADQVYPVGDYPARQTRPAPTPSPAAVLGRLARLTGLGTAATAALLLALTWFSRPPESRESPTQPAAWLADRPVPGQLGVSLQAMVGGLGEVEAEIGQRLGPSLAAAARLPERLDALPQRLDAAHDATRRQWVQLGSDLRDAGADLRRSWRLDPEPPPASGRLPPADPRDALFG
ncbi:MAG: hypothetical protein AAF800_12205 [Planctomycetota bacterium]